MPTLHSGFDLWTNSLSLSLSLSWVFCQTYALYFFLFLYQSRFLFSFFFSITFPLYFSSHFIFTHCFLPSPRAFIFSLITDNIVFKVDSFVFKTYLRIFMHQLKIKYFHHHCCYILRFSFKITYKKKKNKKHLNWIFKNLFQLVLSISLLHILLCILLWK